MNQSQPSRETIAERAYALWEQAGRPLGRDEEFWQRAEAELTAAPSAVPPVIPPVIASVTTTTVAPLHEVPPPIQTAVKTPGRRPPPRRTPRSV